MEYIGDNIELLIAKKEHSERKSTRVEYDEDSIAALSLKLINGCSVFFTPHLSNHFYDKDGNDIFTQDLIDKNFIIAYHKFYEKVVKDETNTEPNLLEITSVLEKQLGVEGYSALLVWNGVD